MCKCSLETWLFPVCIVTKFRMSSIGSARHGSSYWATLSARKIKLGVKKCENESAFN